MLDSQGKVKRMAIPFLPFSKTAFDATVLEADQGAAKVPGFFRQSYDKWKADQKGIGYINIPFKGLLNNMVEDLVNHRSHKSNTA